MKRTILVDSVTYFFILLFLYTGIEKLTEINSFKDQMVSSPLLGPLGGFVAWALPITEILLTIVLFIPKWRLKGLYASLGLMVVFTIYLIVILAIDEHLSCSCGGIIENLTPRQHLLFNGATIVLAALAIVSERGISVSARFQWMSGSGSIALFAAIIWIIVTAYRTPAKAKTGFEGRLLPAFTLLLSDSVTHLNTADIPVGKSFIMMGFSPYCSHCQGEVKDIIKHINQFGNTPIYLVTAWPYSDMKKFYDFYQLKKYPNIIAAVDTKNIFLSNLKARFIPYSTIYDEKKRLKEAITGQTDAAQLTKDLND
jgi:hypothetical protein